MKIRENITREPVSDRDRASELLLRFMGTARNIDGFDGKTPVEVFNPDDEEPRRELIAHLSNEQYIQLITGLNGILRRIGKDDWGADGDGVIAAGEEVVGAHIFPRHSDKKEIIEKSLEGAKEMNDQGMTLEDIGMLLGSIIVETHMFGDGNGRTSRFVYWLVKNGYSSEEKDKIMIALGNDGREDGDMALSKVYIDDLFDRKYGPFNKIINTNNINGLISDEDMGAFAHLVFPEDVKGETKEDLVQCARNDDKIMLASILHFLQTRPEIKVNQYIKNYGERRVFVLQTFLLKTPNEQIEELVQTYWKMKKKYTEDIIDVFVHPDKPEYKIKSDGKEVRMIDYFKDRLRRKLMLY